MFRKLTLAAGLLLAGGSTVAVGQEPVLDELYGRGVHRFFAHDYLNAYEHLTLAIDNGSKDPRVYYFRGLTLIATGRGEEAESDWMNGAMLEAEGTYAGGVGRALARIQGPARLRLEHIRQMARLEAAASKSARDKALYGNGNNDNAVPLPNVSPAPATTPAPADAGSDPFANGGPLGGQGPATVESDNALSDAITNATPEPVTPENGGANPAPANTPAGGDPFGGNTPATNDPFGGGGSNTPANDPFGGGGTPPANDDPFGGL